MRKVKFFKQGKDRQQGQNMIACGLSELTDLKMNTMEKR